MSYIFKIIRKKNQGPRTGGRGFLELQNDGNLVFKSDGIILWSNEKKLIQPYEPLDLTPVKQPSDRLRAGDSLERSSTLTSANGMFKLLILTDGQLIIRRESSSAVIWSNGKTSSSVSKVCFGGIKFDIAMFDTAGKPLWGPFIADSDSMLHLNNDGNLSILAKGADPNNYEDLGKRKWSSNTSFPCIEEEGKPYTKAGRSLRSGQILAANHSLTSKSGEYTFTITEAGDFKITRDSGRTISTIARMAQNANSSRPARFLLLGPDGYLELRSNTVTGPTIWREGNSAARRLVLNDYGLLFLTRSTNEKDTDPDVVWTLPKTLGDRISTGESMYANQKLRSPTGNYELINQGDGNLVLYRMSPDTRAMWASGSYGKKPKKLVVQGDGNVVLYVDDWPPVPWASGTSAGGNTAKREFVLQDNGDVVILENGKQIWSLPYAK
ncbi:hypothetical protein F4823DRAFT_633220 [Ustulina deusta]|nr:hypothetical protein F4823DRAFT_633220 [Ustulina deusta]